MASSLPVDNDCCSECSSIIVEVTTVAGTSNIYFYDTVAALRAGASPTVTDAMANLRGESSAFDGLGGIWYWVSNSTATDDGALWVKPSDKAVGDQGRWRKNV